MLWADFLAPEICLFHRVGGNKYFPSHGRFKKRKKDFYRRENFSSDVDTNWSAQMKQSIDDAGQ
jgi:hypothetical protein